jgi:hypothetical protein
MFALRRVGSQGRLCASDAIDAVLRYQNAYRATATTAMMDTSAARIAVAITSPVPSAVPHRSMEEHRE